jgi:hypothetical protein
MEDTVLTETTLCVRNFSRLYRSHDEARSTCSLKALNSRRWFMRIP